MYIISVDLGSSNFKAIVMKIDGDNISVVCKYKSKSFDFGKFISEIIEKFSIDKTKIEKIVATGTGSSYISDKFENIDIVKVAEFDAIGFGGLILSHLEEGIVASIGTGTAFIYSNLIENKHLGGTGLGGGALVGLGKRLLTKDFNNDGKEVVSCFQKVIDMAKHGNTKNVDLTIGDISKNDIGSLTKDITAANFAAIYKKASDSDYAAGVINMILENIILQANLYNTKKLPIVLIGTMVSDPYIKDCIRNVCKYCGPESDFRFVDESEYAIAIGAYEYYLLRLRLV